LEPAIPSERRPALFIAVGGGIALVSIPLAAAAGPPYLSFGSLSPWLVTFSIGLFAALFATPFALHARLSDTLERDARWERALLIWGAVAVGVLAVGLLCGLPSGFDSDSLFGSIAIVAIIEAIMVLGTLVLWMLSN
jgi:hypothetical protein